MYKALLEADTDQFRFIMKDREAAKVAVASMTDEERRKQQEEYIERLTTTQKKITDQIRVDSEKIENYNALELLEPYKDNSDLRMTSGVRDKINNILKEI